MILITSFGEKKNSYHSFYQFTVRLLNFISLSIFFLANINPFGRIVFVSLWCYPIFHVGFYVLVV